MAGSAVGEPGELVVDGDSHRLEQPGELGRPGARPERGPHGVHQVVAHRERPRLAAPHDLARQPSRLALVAVLVEDAGQLGFVGLVEELRGGRPGPAHPHVQWGARSESKTALRLVQLPGRHARGRAG